MRMTTSELIHAAYHAARYLPKASSQLMRELAERLDTTQAALCESLKIRDALASENGQMLRLLTAISENHDEYVNQDEYLYAGVPMDYVSEINAYVSRDVDAENPFQATDAFLAEVRAQGVDSSIEAAKKEIACEFKYQSFENCVIAAVRYPQSDLSGKVEMIAWLEWFAAQLRGNSNGGAL